MLLFDSSHFDFKEMIYVAKDQFIQLNYLNSLGIRKISYLIYIWKVILISYKHKGTLIRCLYLY